MLLQQLNENVSLKDLEEMYVELATMFNSFIDSISTLNEAVTAPYDDDIELQVDEISKRLEAAKLGLKIAKRLQNPVDKKKHTLRILNNMKQISRSMKAVTKMVAQFARAEEDYNNDVFPGGEEVSAQPAMAMSAEQEEESAPAEAKSDQPEGFTTRDQLKTLDGQVRRHAKNSGLEGDWFMDSGKISLKRNGTGKIVYSVHGDKSAAKKFKKLILAYLQAEGFGVKCRINCLSDTCVVSFTVIPPEQQAAKVKMEQEEESFRQDPLGLEQEEQTGRMYSCDVCGMKADHLHNVPSSAGETHACDSCCGGEPCDR